MIAPEILAEWPMRGAEALPLMIVLACIGSAAAIFMLRDEQVRLRTALGLLGSGVTLVLVVALVLGVLAGRDYRVTMPFVPGVDLVLAADALSILFVALSALLWLITTVYAVGYLRHGPNRSRFFGFFALCVSGTMGIALAGNLLTFVLFYEFLTLATVPLVVHYGDRASLRAGAIYLAYTVTGGAVLLLGTLALYALHGSGDFVIGGLLAQAESRPDDGVLIVLFAVMISGVAVKSALVPVHGWLPVAMVAPAPVSALLHAVAVVKAGAFGIVRVVYDVFGIGLAESLGVLLPLSLVAAATILWGSLRAMYQDDLKKRLAYSTVSQVSYIALGASLAHPLAAVGGIMHLIHQGIMKITLFFCAGAIAETTGVKAVSQMDGLGRRMPWTMAAFTVGAIGMIGLPLTAGFVTKWHLASGGIAAGAPWVLAVLLTSSGLNCIYFLPILQRVWFRQRETPFPEGAPFTAALTGPPIVTALLVIASALFATSVFSPLGWAQGLALREFGFSER